YALVLLAVVAGLAGFLYEEVRRSRYAKVDGDLRAAAGLLDAKPQRWPPFALDGPPPRPPPPGRPPPPHPEPLSAHLPPAPAPRPTLCRAPAAAARSRPVARRPARADVLLRLSARRANPEVRFAGDRHVPR